MNKLKTINEAKALLDGHYRELNKAYDNYHESVPGSHEKLDKTLNKINGYVCFCAGTQLLLDNIEISSSDNIFVFKNFLFIYHQPRVLLSDESKHNRFKITYYRGGYIIPIEEFHYSDKEIYCYTKPSRGQIGLRTEKDLQDYFIDKIESLDGWKCFRLSPVKYGKGVPDVLVKKPNGEPVYIELKTPQETGVLTMGQIKYHEKLRDRGKTVKIFWKKDQLDEFLKNENEKVSEIKNNSLFKSIKDLTVAAIEAGKNCLTLKKAIRTDSLRISRGL